MLDIAMQEMMVDIQLLESANSVITQIKGISPNIGMPLLASRFTQKKHLLLNKTPRDSGIDASLGLALEWYKSTEYNVLTDCAGRWKRSSDASSWLSPDKLHLALQNGGPWVLSLFSVEASSDCVLGIVSGHSFIFDVWFRF